MRNSRKLFFFLIITILFSFSSNSDWITINAKKYTFQIPTSMDEMEDLNAEADAQYGYVENVDDEVLELYLIILLETHKEIKKYNLAEEFTALSYWELAAESLVEGIEESKILTEERETESVNGMGCVRGEIWGKFDDVEVIYHLAVYKGEYAFYQVLTWTIADQHPRFKDDMEHMINSLREK